jgi:hypothetical protein
MNDDFNNCQPSYSYGYTAPELWNDKNNTVCASQLSDIWSIGMIFHLIFFEIDALKEVQFVE